VILNIDAGELDDEPEELYALADLVHVACGGHAGDEASMERVVRACLGLGTAIGAHPSYVDRAGFGRRALDVAPDLLAAQIAEQCARLDAIARAHGARVTSVKPHGALYHAANARPEIARACILGVRALASPSIVGAGHGALEVAAREAGLAFAREAFADRGVRADGTLVPRGEAGALIEDPARAAARARELAARGDVDTICVHGDTRGAIAIARAVRGALGPKAAS
jgi:UPF0271 protein